MTDTTDIKALREACGILNDHGYLTKSGIIRSSNLAEAVRMIIEQSVGYAGQLEAERQRADALQTERDEFRRRLKLERSILEDADTELAALKAKLANPVVLPEGLHPQTAKLVIEFASALAEKLHKAEQKYGYSDTWMQPHWQIKCLDDFKHHVSKGDPRDVAAYCAFMWYHGWSTAVKGE